MSRGRDVFSGIRLTALLLALAAMAPVPAAVPAGAGIGAPSAPSRAVRAELDRAQAQLRESIQPRGAGPAIEILRDPQRVVLRIPARLLFDAESTIPREDAPARVLLMAVRQLLRARTRLAGRIEVYTDGIGGVDANLQLSQRRADALLAWFTEEGIAATRLTTAARGASQPIASDEAPEGRTQNRRIELVFERRQAP
jgi:outer membrane protein OmpA-like peptidoglycan-associated protein